MFSQELQFLRREWTSCRTVHLLHFEESKEQPNMCRMRGGAQLDSSLWCSLFVNNTMFGSSSINSNFDPEPLFTRQVHRLEADLKRDVIRLTNNRPRTGSFLTSVTESSIVKPRLTYTVEDEYTQNKIDQELLLKFELLNKIQTTRGNGIVGTVLIFVFFGCILLYKKTDVLAKLKDLPSKLMSKTATAFPTKHWQPVQHVMYITSIEDNVQHSC